MTKTKTILRCAASYADGYTALKVSKINSPEISQHIIPV